MAKFIGSKEAAEQLGVTPDQLTEMRENGEIHGYRDGTNWKFKTDEVERVLAERQAGGVSDSALSLGDDELKLAPDEDDAEESILVSEEELGHSGESTSSTIIGKMSEKVPEDDSDLKLAGPAGSSMSFLPEAMTGSEMKLVPGGDLDSDLTLIPGAGGDTDVTLVPGVSADSDVSLIPTGSSDSELGLTGSKHDVLAGTDLQLDAPSSGGTGGLGGRPSELALGSSDLDLHLDSGLSIAEDDELVLGSAGSDVSLDAEGSGINLTSPTDSGLSLEDEPLDLAGSSKVSSLELPEDEEGLSLDDMAGAGVKQDEEFLLSPSGDSGEDSESGSQVIALEESTGGFDLDPNMLGAAPVLEEQPGLGASLDAGLAPAPMAVMPAGAYVAHEAPYSIGNVLGLFVIFAVLSVGGMLMVDVVRNMWSWNGDTPAVTSVAEGIAGIIGY